MHYLALIESLVNDCKKKKDKKKCVNILGKQGIKILPFQESNLRTRLNLGPIRKTARLSEQRAITPHTNSTRGYYNCALQKYCRIGFTSASFEALN